MSNRSSNSQKQICNNSSNIFGVSKITYLLNLQKNSYYSQSQLKRFIPIHYPTLKGNVLSIFQSVLFSLTQQYGIYFSSDIRFIQILKSVDFIKKAELKYNQYALAWIQDIDQHKQDHLKRSLQIAVILCDYLKTLCIKKKQFFSQEKQKITKQTSSIDQYSKITKFRQSHFHKSKQSQSSCIAKIQKLSLLIGDNQQTSSQQYQTLLFSQQKQASQFVQAYKPIFYYYFWRQPQQKKYYFAIGANSCPIQSAYLAIQNFRQWNSIRLGLKHEMKSYQTLEHLFSISRSFLLNKQLEDFNNNKLHLKNLNKILKQDKIQLNSIQLYHLLRQKGYLTHLSPKNKQSQKYSKEKPNLQPTILHIYKSKIVAKDNLQNSQTQKQIYQFVNFLWSQILLYTQGNSPCSYSFSYQKDDSINQISFICSIHSKLNLNNNNYDSFRPNKSSLKNSNISSNIKKQENSNSLNQNTNSRKVSLTLRSQEIQKMIQRAIDFQNNKNYQQSLTAQTVADSIFKKSIQILKRYDKNNLVKNHQQMVEIENSRMNSSKTVYQKNVTSFTPSPIKKILNANQSQRSILNKSTISYKPQGSKSKSNLNQSYLVQSSSMKKISNSKGKNQRKSPINKSIIADNAQDSLNKSTISVGRQSPSILKIQNIYYQLLKKIQKQIQISNEIKKINQEQKISPNKTAYLNKSQINKNNYNQLIRKKDQQNYQTGIQPQKLKTALLENIYHIQKTFQITPTLSQNQHNLFKSIGAMCKQLKPQQIALMINKHCVHKQFVQKNSQNGYQNYLNDQINFHSFNQKNSIPRNQKHQDGTVLEHQFKIYHPQNLDPIIEIFFQPQQWQLAQQIGKNLAQSNLIKLYKKYLSAGSLKNYRFSLIPQFLKNVIQKYSSHYSFKNRDNQKQISINLIKRIFVNINEEKLSINTGDLINLFTLKDELDGFTNAKSHNLGSIVNLNISNNKMKNSNINNTDKKVTFNFLYQQLLQKLIPTLFSEQEKQKSLYTIAGILNYFYQYLNNFSNKNSSPNSSRDSGTQYQDQLILSFIIQLAFQSIFYTHEKIQFELLNNNPYIRGNSKNNIDQTRPNHVFGFYDSLQKIQIEKEKIKAKKVTQLIRQYGFKGMGFQSKTYFLPLIETLSKQSLKKYQNPIYYMISIKRPLFVNKFMSLLQQSHFTRKFIQIITYYNKNPAVRTVFQKNNDKGLPKAHCYYKSDILDFSFELKAETMEEQNDKFLAEGAKNSQSGIFQQLYSYNPQIKIAGLPLSRILQPKANPEKWSALQKRSQADTKNTKIFDINTAVQKAFPGKTLDSYDLIRTVLNLRQKYIKYHLLDQQQRIYFRQIVSEIVQKREAIENYLQITRRLNLYKRQIKKNEKNMQRQHILKINQSSLDSIK